jgi:hypothetical protein
MSYVDRLASDLEVPAASVLRATGVIGERDVFFPASYGVRLPPERVQAFARAVGLEPARISAMLLSHYEGSAFELSTRVAASLSVQRDTWAYLNGSHFCPACLSEGGGVWLLAWKLPWSFACVEHRALLVDTCPRCGLRPAFGPRGRLNAPAPLSTVPRPGCCSHGLDSGKAGGAKQRPPLELCGEPLGRVMSQPLDCCKSVLETQLFINRALAGNPVSVGGSPIATREYFHDLRSLCVLILYATNGDDLADLPPPTADALSAYVIRRGSPHLRKFTRHGAAATHMGVPRSASLMAAIVPAAARILAIPSRAELEQALAPLMELARPWAPDGNLYRLFPFSSRLGPAIDASDAHAVRAATLSADSTRSPARKRTMPGRIAATRELVGVYEASLILGVEKAQVAGWASGKIPGGGEIASPVARLKCGPIWLRAQIDSKLKALYRERTGRIDDDDMRRWAWERSLLASRKLGITSTELERLTGQPPFRSHPHPATPCSPTARKPGTPRCDGDSSRSGFSRNAANEDLHEQLLRRLSGPVLVPYTEMKEPDGKIERISGR